MTNSPLTVTHVTARYFRSAEHLDFTVPDQGLHTLSGRVGAGKSTILAAIRFGLFGASPATYGDLVNTAMPKGKTCQVEVTFTSPLGKHTISRKLSRREKNGKTSYSQTATMTTNGTKVEGIKSTELTSHVESLIGMKAAAFSSATFIAQHDTEALAVATPAELEQAIESFTDLSSVTRARTTARADALAAEKHAAALPGDANHVAELEQRQDDARANAEELTAAAQQATTAHQEAKKALSEAKTKLRDAEKVHHASAEHRQAITAATARLDAARERVDALADQCPHAPKATVEDLTAIQQDISETAQQLSAATTATSAEQVDHDVERAQERLAEATAQCRAAERDYKQAKDTSSNSTDRTQKQLSQAQTTARDLAGQIHALHASSDSLKDAATRLRNADGGCCPTCHQQVTNPSNLADSLRAQASDKHNKAVAAKRELAQIEFQIQQLNDQLADANNAARGVEQAVHALNLAQANRHHAYEQLNAARVAKEDAVEVDTTAITEHLRDLLTRTAQLTDHEPFDTSDLLAAARTAYRALSGAIGARHAADAHQQQMQQARTDLDASTTELSQLRDQTIETVTDEELSALRQAVEDAADAEDSAEVTRAEATAVASSADAAMLTMDSELGFAQQQLNAKTTAEHAAAVARGTATVIAAVRSDLLADYCARISEGATEFVTSITDEFTAVAIEDDFKITVTLTDGTTRSVRTLSGGEQTIVGIGLRLGISRLLAGGELPDQLIADEITSNLDAETTRAVFTALGKMFTNALVVTHSEVGHELADEVHTITRATNEPTALAA